MAASQQQLHRIVDQTSLQGTFMVAENGSEARFFRFPVSALNAEPPTVYERIVRYCLVDCVDNTVSLTFDDDRIELIAEEERSNYPDLKGILSQFKTKLLVAAKLLNVKLGTLDERTHRSCYDDCVQHFGRCFVVFPRDKFWEYAGDPSSYREFAILCGVFAGIGNDTYKKLQYERIGALASGYSSVDEMTRNNGTPRYTREQVRWTVDKLEEKGWFIRCPANKRHMYYSKRLGLQDLQMELAKMVAAKQRKRPPMSKRAEEITRLLVKLELEGIDPRNVRK